MLSSLSYYVENWMLEKDISFVPGPSFSGRSGLQYKFDFAIGRNKRQPTRLIKTVNNPNRQGVQNALFGWEDVRTSRLECKGYVFLNSANACNKVVPDYSIEACEAYGLIPVIWGVNQDSFITDLAA